MHLDEFAVGVSFLHRLDPRIKFVVFVPLVFVAALSPDLFVGFFFLAISVAATMAARLSARAVAQRLLVVNTFIAFLWMTLPASIQGCVLFSLGPWAISREGVIYTLLISLKANAVFLFTLSILGTSEIFALVHALDHFKVPKQIIYLFFFFYRYVTVLHQEYNKVRAAVKARGFVPKTNLHTWKTYAYLVGMLFVRSYERSKRIYQAMTLRGFKGYFPLITHFHIHACDIVFAVVMYGIMALAVIFCLAL